jgi:hypothetical protein
MKTNDVILWKERFADRAASGLKVEDWCKRNGVTNMLIITGTVRSRMTSWV